MITTKDIRSKAIAKPPLVETTSVSTSSDGKDDDEYTAVYPPLRSAPVVSIPRVSLHEHKFNTVYRSMGGCPNGGDIYTLNILSQGTDVSERIGRKVTSEWVDIDFLVGLPTEIGAIDALRVLLVYDQQPNGTTATETDLLDTGIVTKPYLAPINRLVNVDRFVVLKDWHSDWSGMVSTSSMWMTRPAHFRWHIVIPKRLRNATYGITGNAVPITGCITLAVFSYYNNATTANNNPFAYAARYFFKDS